MTTPLASLIATGTKLWLDSIDPELVHTNRQLGATGATSNPVIVADLLKTGRFDQQIIQLLRTGVGDDVIAWKVTDELVQQAQDVFAPVWKNTGGNDGYVSFELDPLIEDPARQMPLADQVAAYIELGKKWSAGHDNRMIKVPATPGGLAALEELCAAGISLNVTLIFTERQYLLARDAIWRGAQRRSSLAKFKSVYSIFVSRVDQYTEKHAPQLSPAAQGQYGIVNAKRIWKINRDFWRQQQTPLAQELIFASTGTKNPHDPPWKYVAAFAGSDIETNPPATNAAVQASGRMFTPQIEELPSAAVLAELDAAINVPHLEETLMTEGIQKFADPQKSLLALIARKRQELAS
ncbi:MAG: transaldolase family protein [Pirellulales bacterium]|nr:transaldolase family protein [Pirellulales bacterium]